MIRFFKISISNKQLSEVMYALLKTQSKLVNSFSHSINQYTRKQSSGFIIDVVIDIDENKIEEFEELTNIKLQTSEQLQGKLTLN